MRMVVRASRRAVTSTSAPVSARKSVDLPAFVTDHRHPRERLRPFRCTSRSRLIPDSFLEVADAGPDRPAIGFDLCLAGTFRAHAAILFRQMRPLAGEPSYTGWASSTCVIASFVFARFAKMSR